MGGAKHKRTFYHHSMLWEVFCKLFWLLPQSRLEAVMDHIRAEQAVEEASDDTDEMDESTYAQTRNRE